MMLIGLDKSGQKSDIYHTARQERRKPKGEIQMKNKKYYIAYGSNLSVEQMADRCPDAKIAGQAVLAGWELLFRGCATIAPNPKKNTPVLVWEISERDEGNLDLYEGYPNYYRKEDLNIELLREGAEPEMVTAMVYIMENDFGHRAPSRYYYKVLHDGYKAFHFPMHILEGALKECMDKVVAGGSKLWVNSLWASLCGGLDDDAAFGGDPAEVYGKLVDMGATMIQTDRPELLISYLRSRGLHN